MIVLSNNSGIGNQSRRLCQMLKPYRILAIDSSGFSKNKDQHWDWYDGFNGYKIKGFPTNSEVRTFLDGLTHVLCIENPFNPTLLSEAKKRGIKVYIQSNYEFCDHLNSNMEPPHKFLMPSWWHLDTMIAKFGTGVVEYLPPPVDPQEFKHTRDVNFIHSGKRELLHVIGTLATHDRNGTLDILDALKYTTHDFTLTIRSQHDLPPEYKIDDRRVRYQIGDIPEPAKLYEGYDALILPRRYGGLSLTMQEALMSGLPVIMTAISPNIMYLPGEWVVKAHKVNEFMARTMIDVYGCNIQELAAKIDWIADQDCEKIKVQAFDIGHTNYAPSVLKPLYDALWT